MAKSKPGDIIFHRGKKSDHDDIWDDSVLIESYERAASLAYDAVRATLQSNGEYSAEEMMKHGVQTNNVRERKQSLAGNSSVSGTDTSCNKKGRRKRRSHRKKWEVGDKCLAKYAEDDNWYEATVVAIDRSHNRCTVRYTGYDNDEVVNLGMLQKCPDTSMDDDASSRSERDEDGGLGEESEEVTHDYDQSQTMPGRASAEFNTVPFLPPPMPPHLLRQQHHGLPDEDEAVAAMLMSWYTSGYHTGYYQALRDMKRNNK